MNIKQNLTEARNLIADPSHWIQEAYARTKDGNTIGPRTQFATCFCAVGAIHRATPTAAEHREAITLIAAQVPPDFKPGATNENRVIEFNDHSTHAEVLSLFDRAIAS